MPASEESKDADGASKPMSYNFILPKRSTPLRIQPPPEANKKSRPRSPNKARSRSPQKIDQTPVPQASPSNSANVSSFGTSRPTTADGIGHSGNANLSQPEPQILSNESISRPFSPIKSTSETSKLDIYAHSYVPLWLRAVNESTAVSRFCSPLETINYSDYIASFAGRQFLQPLAGVNLPPIQHVPVVLSVSPGSLTATNYEAYFGEALQNEVAAEATELRSCSIFMAAGESQDPSRCLFRIKIPGVRENAPRILVGDVVLVRPLVVRPHARELTNAWYAPGGGKDRGHCAPAFSGLEVHAIVWGVVRPKEEIILCVDGYTQLTCNVLFAVQEHRIAPLARSITSTANYLRSSHSDPVLPEWLTRMLFPMPSDGIVQITLPKGTFADMKWIDTQLNYEQQKAVDAIFKSKYGSVPYLISGPPGTGKTKSIVETTLQLLQRPHHLAGGYGGHHQTPHILLCAPSDPAADTLASRLASHLKPAELFRLNGWSRSFPEVPGMLLPYCYVERDLFSLPKFDTLMSYKVVVTTCRDADMLVQARLTNRDLNYLIRSTLRAISPFTYATVPESQLLHWTALLIDEAAQATEPEALIPLIVVAPPVQAQTASQGISSLPQFIMAGDEFQLGPRLYSRDSSALSTSLFARIFSRPFYADHPLSRQKGTPRLTAAMLPMNRPAFTNLLRNYRSHPSILAVPSQLFYNDTLIPECTRLPHIVRSWPGWKCPHSWPVLFVQNTTPDDVESVLTGNGSGAGALFNHGEVLKALEAVKSLLGHHVPNYEVSERIKQDEIAVVSPFKAQVHLLRKIFRENGLNGVNIGPLEAFQGLESRILVLCTTRTRRGTDKDNAARFVKEDRSIGLGVIGYPKRFNVAITRAKEGLIVLGDPETLMVEDDPCWDFFLSFCARNYCVKHESVAKASDSSWVDKFAKRTAVKEGRLEKALVLAADAKMKETPRNGQKGFGYPESPNTRRQKRLSLKGQMLTTDEEMWQAGLQMAEEINESTLLEDVNGAQEGALEEEGNADPWNPDRDPAKGKEGMPVIVSPTLSPMKPEATTQPANNIVHVVQDKRISSTASAKDFDRDPQAEFERTDCATQ